MSDIKKDKETDKVIREHAGLFRLTTREGLGVTRKQTKWMNRRRPHLQLRQELEQETLGG